MKLPFLKRTRHDLEPFFGTLEIRVLEALWACSEPQSVRDIQPAFDGVAYTTVMTTLDRLHRKGVLDREKAGRAYVYRPRYTQEELLSGLAGEALASLFGSRATELKPILSFFVETISREDRESLDALERLVAERRRQLEEQDK